MVSKRLFKWGSQDVAEGCWQRGGKHRPEPILHPSPYYRCGRFQKMD